MTPAKKLSPSNLVTRLAEIKLLSLDVDGVMTDGGLYFTDDGHQMRKFHAHDGVGIKRVLATDVEIAIVTASKTKAVPIRAGVLGIRHVFLDAEDKLSVLSGLCRSLGLDLKDAAHVGDDLNDLPLLQAVGLPLTVPGAVPEILNIAQFITERRGGEGAVREICDYLVASRSGADVV